MLTEKSLLKVGAARAMEAAGAVEETLVAGEAPEEAVKEEVRQLRDTLFLMET